MRIALLTSNKQKADEFASSLGGHGQKVTVEPWDRGSDGDVLARNLLDGGHDFVIREETLLIDLRSGEQVDEPADMAEVINLSRMSIWRRNSDETRRKDYTSEMRGFIDLDLRSGGGDVFGWDDIFVPINASGDLHSMKRDNMKTSARQINIGRFLADHVHFSHRLDMQFFPMRQDSTFEFNAKAFDFVTTNDLIARGTSGHWLGNILGNVLDSGIFFRSAANRKEKNYWLPGLNAGIPLTAKKDEIHEITFLFHDLMHFQLPDLIPDVGGAFPRQVYIMHRVMGEALTLVLADMIFIDNLKRAGVEYDFSKRLIYPLFQHMDVGGSLSDLKPLVRAMAHYAVLNDDSLLRSLLKPGAEAAEALGAFKGKYGHFFSEDLRWTERNFQHTPTSTSTCCCPGGDNCLSRCQSAPIGPRAKRYSTMIMSHKELDFDDRINVAAVLEFLSKTRQAAYNLAKETPALTAAYERAEEAYLQFTEEFGIEPRPIFDADEYSAARQASGDALYENWKAPTKNG